MKQCTPRTQVTDLVSFWFAERNQKFYSKGRLGEVVSDVKKHCQIFSKLSPDLLLIILNTIKAVMRDKNLLQELRQKVSEAFLIATVYNTDISTNTPPVPQVTCPVPQLSIQISLTQHISLLRTSSSLSPQILT